MKVMQQPQQLQDDERADEKLASNEVPQNEPGHEMEIDNGTEDAPEGRVLTELPESAASAPPGPVSESPLAPDAVPQPQAGAEEQLQTIPEDVPATVPQAQLQTITPEVAPQTVSEEVPAASVPPKVHASVLHALAPVVGAGNNLIVSGKRNRKKVDKSADFLTASSRPTRAAAAAKHLPSAPEPEPIAASSTGKKRKRSAKKARGKGDLLPAGGGVEAVDNAPVKAELSARRERLLQRKAELEAYLKRLQTALSAERRRSGAIVSELDEMAAATGSVEKKKKIARRRSSVKAVKKEAVVQRKTSVIANVRPHSAGAAASKVATVSAEDQVMGPSTRRLCARVVDDLLHNQYGEIFAVAVDWEALNLPTYPQVVKNPMDLGTVKERLEAGSYETLDMFAKNIQLIWDNAKLFNAPKSFVYEATLEMERIWTRKYTNLMREKRRSSIAPEEPQASLSIATADTDVRMSPAFVPAAAAERPLSFSEKSKLRSDIMKAPQSHIDTIVSITREAASAQSGDSSQEIEIDIEQLDTATLRKLQKFVATIVPSGRGRGSGGSGVSSAAASASHGAGHRKRPLASSAGSLGSRPAPVFDSESDADSDSDSSSSSGLESDSSEDVAAVNPVVSHVTTPSAAETTAVNPLNGTGAALTALAGGSGVASPAQETEEREDVQIENTDAWSALDDKQKSGAGDVGGDDVPQTSALWNNFRGDAAQKKQKELELREREAQKAAERLRHEQELKALEEKRRLEKAQEEQDALAEKEKLERERLNRLQEEREAARQAREQDMDEDVDDQAGAVEEFQNLMSA